MQSKIKMFFTIIGLAFALFSAMVVVAPPTPAYAQCSCGAPCTAPGVGIGQAITTADSARILPALNESFRTLTTLYNNLSNTLNQNVTNSITTADNNLKSFLESLVAYDLTPAQKDQTAQLNVSTIDQSRNLNSFTDGQQHSRTVRHLQDIEAAALQDNAPNPQTCPAGTLNGGLQRARLISKKLSIAHSNEDTITPNPLTYQKERFERQQSRYRNGNANNGVNTSGGSSDAAYVDADILIEETVFKEETIDDYETPERQEAIADLARNLTQPEVPGIVPKSAFENPAMQEQLLNNRVFKSQKNLAKKAFFDVSSRRAPGSRVGQYIQELREATGADLSEISENPSQNEVIKALAEDRFWSGVYGLESQNTPIQVTKEKITLQATELMQMHDYMDMIDKMTLILAAQIANETLERGDGADLTNEGG